MTNPAPSSKKQTRGMCSYCQSSLKKNKGDQPLKNTCYMACKSHLYKPNKETALQITCGNFSHISSIRIK